MSEKKTDNKAVAHIANLLGNQENVMKLYELFYPTEGITVTDGKVSFKGGYLEAVPTSLSDGSNRPAEDIVRDYEVRKAVLNSIRSVLGAISKELNPKKEAKETPSFK